MHSYWQTGTELLPRTRPQTIKRLQSLGLNTYFDLLEYFPHRYEDYSLIAPISSLQEGELVTVQGQVSEASNTYTRKRITIQKITITDGEKKLQIVWFNQPFLLNILKEGSLVSIAGTVKKQGPSLTLEPKEHEVIHSFAQKLLHTGRLIPVYSETYGLSTKTIREKISGVLQNAPAEAFLEEILPAEIVNKHGLISTWEAYRNIHYPDSKTLLEKARARLSFDELFTIQLGVQKTKESWQQEKVGHMFTIDDKNNTALQTFIKNLPFTLTGAQQRVWEEIKTDLKRAQPMNRFIQGDVGSGKTIVAALAAYTAYLNGYQSLYMAPTEILAQQHFATFEKLFKDYPIKIGLQTGSHKIRNSKSEVPNFTYDIIIGTHALVSDKFNLEKVGIVIVDEQHRFGVAQRAKLKQKGSNPHLLSMTATPIPRTVTLTLYGELDMSIIDELPQGRKPIKTYVVPPQKRDDAYGWMKKLMQETQCQIFIICPLIEESEGETMLTVKAAEKEYEYLRTEVFTKHSVGLLHGKMKPREKEAVMLDFKNKVYDILVSTSVVEVGIDIPNATIMLIEGAERFGLAQLHQLRGRVGRGELQSHCLLFTSETDGAGASYKRLQFFSHTNNGMELAEYDLKRRGPGDIYGKSQHGYTDLKIADLSDLGLIEKTKSAAQYFNTQFSLKEYPIIAERLKKHDYEEITRD